MFKSYFKTAFRSLVRNTFYTAINIFGLAIGLATCLLIFLYVLDELNYEKLFSVEEKCIKNEISRDTYDRWSSTYNHSIINLKGAIERLSKDQSKVFDILNKHSICLPICGMYITRPVLCIRGNL